MNIKTVLLSYIVEVMNMMMIFGTLPYIYLLIIKPLPLFMAQFVFVILHCCGSLIVALGSAISCFHISFVVKFETVFSLDPQEVGRRTFTVLTVLICLPNITVGTYNLVQGLHSVGGAAILTQTEYRDQGVRFIPTYSLLWTSTFLILSFFAYAFIPIFVKKTVQINLNNQPSTQRTNSLQRYLVGSLGLLICLVMSVVFGEQKIPNYRPILINGYIFLFSFDIILAYFISATEVSIIIRRYIFNLLKIEETHAAGTHIQANNMRNLNCLPQSTVTAARLDTPVNSIPHSTLIIVSSARSDTETV
jgi:hypothetical protein